MRKSLLLVIALLLAAPALPAQAQTATPDGPVYIVQPGDNLWDIASRFNVSVDELATVNNISNSAIYPGDRLVIPGLAGISGTMITYTVQFGDTLRSLSRQVRTDTATLFKLNHAISPVEFYAGYSMILLEQEERPAWSARASLAADETLLELAVRQNTSPWTIAAINGLSAPALGLVTDMLFVPGEAPAAVPGGLPAGILAAQVDPLPITQGQTTQIKLTTSQPVTLGGRFMEHELHFFPVEGNTQVALQGIHAMAVPGLYPLHVDMAMPDGTRTSFEQMIMIVAGSFLQDPVLQVEASTIDPAVTEPENAWLAALTAVVTPERYWQGLFQLPVDSSSYCLKSRYGNRRSYNGSAFIYFHTGLDFGVCSEAHPFDIYAPAAGRVVYTGLQTVRGNATLIDHGWGVFSGIYHQEEFYVQVGDVVTAGQLIGKIGATGRVTGAHLHWEVWANGVQVDPDPWLDQAFPH
jgi:murein DD-endopeptidase MepM/ murein hydrolase activator NlpD